jgi:hypothetical protein
MSAYHALANAFFAVGGFILAIVGTFGVLVLLLRIYLEFEGFVASKFEEDAGCNGSDRNGSHEIHGGVDSAHRSERNRP